MVLLSTEMVSAIKDVADAYKEAETKRLKVADAMAEQKKPKRVSELDWRPIEYAKDVCKPGSEQIVILYRPQQDPSESYLEYMTSNPAFAGHDNAIKAGYTEFAILVDV